MCLSSAIRQSDNSVIMKNISRIEAAGDELIIRNLFGEVLKVTGAISSVDFEKNEFVICCADQD